jgi:glycosyltransferase involved in cell wall biosynthesis
MKPLLSILTPAIPSRWDRLQKLSYEIARQIENQPVEHLILIDNKQRTVGEKRDALLRAARGQYVAFVDDDDWIEPDYISSILGAIKETPDVVTFRQSVTVDGAEGEVEFKLGNANEGFKPGAVTLRAAWHICAWRRALAVMSRFPSTNYGEDWAFAEPLNRIAKTEVHIPRVLHRYIYDSNVSEAKP